MQREKGIIKNWKMKQENIFYQNKLHFSDTISLLANEIYFLTDVTEILIWLELCTLILIVTYLSCKIL